MNGHRFCVIMCGGVGTRFWPFSRDEKPKQFLDFFGTGKSLLQMTFDRIMPVVPADNIILVTNEKYYDLIREQLPQVKESNILLEPARRNTAPCICWAANHIKAIDPEASIVTLPSDHLVLKENQFCKAIEEGFEFVEKGDRLLTLGVKPSHPHTGYGYIQQGKPEEPSSEIFKVKSFTEKPDLDMAELFIESGEFFWNSGIFLWTAESILEAFNRFAPEISQVLDSPQNIYGSSQEQAFINSRFLECMNISIDYAIMEKASNVYVKIVEFGWSDLGTWNALYENSPRTNEGNVTQNCKVITSDCHGNIFAAQDDKIIVASGLKDYIVADTPHALLIYPLTEEQKIRNVVNEVKTRFGSEYL